MPVQVVTLTCPHCNATLTIDGGRETCFCSYCGTPVKVVNENEYVIRHVDEAEIRHAETERDVQMKQLEIDEGDTRFNQGARKTIFHLWIAAIVVIALLCLYVAFFTGANGGIYAFDILICVGAPIAAGGAYLLFKLIPDRQHDKVIRAQGGVRFPKGYEPFTGQNYETVLGALTAAGFTNVTAINKHDMLLGLLMKPGLIEKITVDGEAIQFGGRYYSPDAPIVITYHGV